MSAKKHLTLTVIIGFCFTTASLLAMEKIGQNVQIAAANEMALAARVHSLFGEAMDENEYDVVYSANGSNGKRITICLEPYPQHLIHPFHRSTSPQEAITNATISSPTRFDYQDDGSQPLRLRQHATRNSTPLFPFKIKLCITNFGKLSFDRLCEYLCSENELFRKCLYSLKISGCEIDTVNSSSLSRLASLNALNLRDNRIATLNNDEEEEEDSRRKSLEYLDLSLNNIEQLGSFFTKDFMWLKVLDLERNQIAQLPGDCLKGLTMLSNLVLSDNNLSSDGLSAGSFNSVSSLSCFVDLKVTLDGNDLMHFPNMGTATEKLTELSMDDNPLDEVPLVLNYPSLTKLHFVNDLRDPALQATLKDELTPLLPGVRIILKNIVPLVAEIDGVMRIVTTPTKSSRPL